MKRDLYREVSDRIVAELERGAAPWVRPWSATAGVNTPCNAATNRRYFRQQRRLALDGASGPVALNRGPRLGSTRLCEQYARARARARASWGLSPVVCPRSQDDLLGVGVRQRRLMHCHAGDRLGWRRLSAQA